MEERTFGTYMEGFDLECDVELWNLRYGKSRAGTKKDERLEENSREKKTRLHTHEVRTPHICRACPLPTQLCDVLVDRL